MQSLYGLSVRAFNSHWHKHPPSYPPLSALRSWSGGMLILRSKLIRLHSSGNRTDLTVGDYVRLLAEKSRNICKADIRNPLSLLAHERSRFATCQWELLTPTDISIPLTHRLVLYTLESGECLFRVHIKYFWWLLICICSQGIYHYM